MYCDGIVIQRIKIIHDRRNLMFLHFRGNSGEGTEIFDIEAGQELSLGTDCAATKNIGRKFTGRAESI
jgi:hypothetical protein